MDYIYVLVYDDNDWEDIVIFLSEDEAKEESIKYPKGRIEIFSKIDKKGYTPTYNYYKNGIYIQKS